MRLLNKLKLRKTTEPCTLVGPTIRHAKKYYFSLNGTHISIAFPRNYSSRKYPISHSPKKEYNLENYYFKDTIPSKKGWGSFIWAARAWDFYGPLFCGELGTVTMTATIDSPRDLKENISLFHPRAFEQVIGDFMTFLHGDEIYLHGQQWLAPTNWQPIEKFPSVCAKFEVQSAVGANNYECWISLPISNSHLLSLSFSLDWESLDTANPKAPLRENVHHDISAMQQLCEEIMNSLEVQLSDKALAQQREALTGLEDTSLVKEYPPLKWEQPKELA